MRYSNPGNFGPSAAEIEQLSRQYFGPQKPREIDYLAYMIDECNLNDWQKTAFADMLGKLRAGKVSWLSEKQKASVVKAIKEYNVFNEDVVQGYLTRGYNEAATVKTPVQRTQAQLCGKDAAANQGEDEDLDDVAF